MGTSATIPLEIVWGQRVKARRTLLRLSQHDLAVKVGRTAQTIYKIEKGLIAPRDSLKIDLGEALRTTPDLLFPWAHQLDADEAAA